MIPMADHCVRQSLSNLAYRSRPKPGNHIATQIMRFLSMLRVREGQSRLVPDPVMPGFSEPVFHDVFLAYGDGSSEDLCARTFGGLIAMRVGRVFSTLREIEHRCRKFSYDEVAEALATYLHRTQIEVFTDYRNALAEITQISREALHDLRTSEDEHGNRFTPFEILQAGVDGTRHILRHARDQNGFGGQGTHPEVDDLRVVLPVVIRLASQLESLRDQWHTVLWGGARAFVDVKPPYAYIIDKHVSKLQRLASVDLSRRESAAARDGDEIQKVNVAAMIGPKPALIRNGTSPQGSQLTVVTVDTLPERLQQMAIDLAARHLALVDWHVQFFLDTSHASLKGVTYRKVLDAWFCLTLLVLDDWNAMQDDQTSSGKYSPSLLTAFALDELASAFCTALGVTLKQAKAILNFLTYKGGHQTLWSRPLLATGNAVLLLWWPLQAGHLMRLIAGWGTSESDSDEPYSDKGHRYEDLVGLALERLRNNAAPAIRFTPLGARQAVKEKAADGNDVGDVDAAFIIGKTLFILECRALGYPAEPYEFWSVNDALEDKVRQAQRKKDHIVKNPGVVAAWFRQKGIAGSPPEIERVVAIVVSNSFLLEGERTEEPYFLHLDTLYNVLLTGQSVFGGGFNLEDQEIDFHVDFRSEDLTVAEAVIRTLRNPPKAEAFKACVVPLDMTIPPFDQTDSPGHVRSPIVTIPSHQAEIESMLSRCSFAPYVTRVGSK